MSQQLVFEKKPFAGYKEFYLTTETMLPTKPPAEQWLLKTRGTPTTPFSKTLEAAISKGMPGGLSATQQIVVTEYAKRTPFDLMYYPITEPSARIATGGLTSMLFGFGVATGLKAIGYQPTKEFLAVTPKKISVPQRQLPTIKEIIGLELSQIQKQFLKPVQIQEPSQILRIQQAQKTIQIQKQIQRQQMKQIQIQRPRLIRQQMQIPKWLTLGRPSRKRKKKKKKSQFGLYGRYPRAYPIATAKEVLEMLF